MKKGLALVLALVMLLSVAGVVFATQAWVNPDVTITPSTANVTVGSEVNFTAAWLLDKDATHYQWSVTAPDESVWTGSEVAIPEEYKKEGNASLMYTFNQVGTYTVSFRIWHHQERLGRDEIRSATITVITEECPAAPAIANVYLDSIGFTGGRGDIITAVSDAMGPGTDFQGISKCIDGQSNYEYQLAVEAFVQDFLNKLDSEE